MTGLRIGLLLPTYWPEVRRGSERMAHDLAVSMVERGHEVEILTSHRGSPRRAMEEGVEVRRAWRPPEPLPFMRVHEYHLARLAGVPLQLGRRPRHDVLHALFPTDAWAAVRWARRRGGPPVVFSFNGYPAREYLVARRLRLEMLEAIVAGAQATTVLSEAAAEPFRRYLRHDPLVMPPGVFTERFALERRAPSEPTLLTTASLGDPRKRGPLLLEAFERLRERLPGVRLVVASPPDPVMSPERLLLPEGVRAIEVSGTDELARAYAGATASVLAAPGEAFGLVLVESLAAGTPVVAADSGAVPEIVADGETGAMFETDDAGSLARAMERAIELADEPGSVERCRRAAQRFDWSVVAGSFEELYRRLAASG